MYHFYIDTYTYIAAIVLPAQRHLVRVKRTHPHTHTFLRQRSLTHIPGRGKSAGCMILNQLPSGLNKSHPRIRHRLPRGISQPIYRHRHRLLFVRVFGRLDSDSTAGTHNLERPVIKTTHRPRRPFHRAWCCLAISTSILDLIPSHLGRPRCFSDLTVFPYCYSCCCST